MERGPHIGIIGDASEEERGNIRSHFLDTLYRHGDSLPEELRKDIEQAERPLSEKEKSLIIAVNEEINALMRDVGGHPYDIPNENFHVISRDVFCQLAQTTRLEALCERRSNLILFDQEWVNDNSFIFADNAFHEALHIKASYAVEVKGDEESLYERDYRSGVTVYGRMQSFHEGMGHEHFSGLHEAIVSYQEKKSVPKLLALPELEKEREWLRSHDAQEMREKISQKQGVPIDDINWVGDREGDHWRRFPYYSQRQVLAYICEEVQKEFYEQFATTDDVFKVFLKAHFTGRLLPIARLVEKTFGEGSFRLLGNMGVEEGSGVLHFESLKKARVRHLHSRAQERIEKTAP